MAYETSDAATAATKPALVSVSDPAFTPETICRRFSTLESDRKTIEQVWDYIEKYVVPIRGGKFFQDQTSEHSITFKRVEVFDDTAINGADLLSSSLQGSLTSPATRWFDMGFRNPRLQKDKASVAWLQECTTIMYNAIQGSNFNLKVSEFYLDMVGFGNGSLTLDEVSETATTFEGLNFDSIPLREFYFECDKEGQSMNMYRRHEWTPSQIVDKFGIENCPEIIVKAYQSGQNLTTKHKIIYCVYRRPEIPITGKIAAPGDRPFGCQYIHYDTKHNFNYVSGYHELSNYIGRWRLTSGSIWGHGPGNLALPTILTLNRLIEMTLKANEKVIDPAIVSQDRNIIGDINLNAAGHTVVRDIKQMEAFESKARFDVSNLSVDNLQNTIRRLFRVDQLELKESPAMTATEVQVRYELMNRLLGPALGRIQTDIFDRVLSRVFNILYRAKQFPDAPPLVIELRAEVDVEYIGPLARAQKMDEVAAIERWLGTIASLAELLPELASLPDPYQIGLLLAQKLNIPTDLIREEADFNTINNLKEQLAQTQQQMEMMQQAATTAKAVNNVQGAAVNG